MLGEDSNQIFITTACFEENEIFRRLSFPERKEFTGVTKDIVQILQNSIKNKSKGNFVISKNQENKNTFF